MPDLDTPSRPHADSRAKMTDVSTKPWTARTAVASGRVLLGDEAFGLVRDKRIQKGDVLAVAQVAGMLGAKRTSSLFPLCHDVLLQNVEVNLSLNEDERSVDVRAIVKADGPTGVEMEALTAVSVAALTVYDMCKGASKDVVVTDVRLLAKTGGQSGDYLRSDN